MAADVAFNEYAFPASQLPRPEPPFGKQDLLNGSHRTQIQMGKLLASHTVGFPIENHSLRIHYSYCWVMKCSHKGYG
jgi:hypothetical protein